MTHRAQRRADHASNDCPSSELAKLLCAGTYTNHSVDVRPLANDRAVPALTEFLADAIAG